MIVETVITSVPRGLKAGRTGYQPVMRTRGLRDDVLRQLEPLTGYRHIHRQGSGKNPVNYTYRRLASNVGDLAVLGRTVDAGSDFSNRSNKCGHLIAFTADEIGRLSRTTPAALLADNQALFASQWTKGPEERPAPPALAAQPQTPAICPTWQSQFGDAGWAAVVAERARRRQPTLLVAPDSSPQSSELLLLLIREATALLPPADRWAVSFETTVLGASDALIQGTYRGSPEAEATRQGVLVLPLGGPVPPGALQENDLCKIARFGPPQPAAAVPPPVAPTATLPPAGEDFLSNSPTAPAAGSPPPLLPSTPNRRVGSFEPLPKGKQVPWGTIIGASVLFPFIAFCVAWFIWSTISAEIVQRRDDARKTLTTYANYDFLNGEKDNQDAPPAPPTAETWNLANLSSLDVTPNDAWVKNANFILRLKGVNGDCVRDWSTEDPTNENHKKILSLINKPTNEFTIDDFVSLGILKSSPDKKYETQVLSFLNPAFSSGELQLLDNANALVTALQSLSDLPNQPQELTTEKLDEVAKKIEGCQWKYKAQLIWPSDTSLKNRVAGYVKALCSSDAPVISERTPAYYLEIMNTQVAAMTKLKKYRLKNKETKPPTDHDYQLAYGRLIVPDDLKQYNDALAEFPPDVLPQFEALDNKVKQASKAATERMDQQPADSSPSEIFTELKSHFKVEWDADTYTLASDVKDLDKLKDLTPRAWSLKGAAPHLEFKRDSNPQSGDRVWLASVNNSPAGRLEIKPAEKKVIFRATEGAPTLAYYTPIDLTWNGRSTPSTSLENKPKTVELRSDQSIRDLIERRNVKVDFDGVLSNPT
ncbi:hypothetical protein EBU58_02930, partial [bacterium]|nr:hypothetical protein [bacterium]